MRAGNCLPLSRRILRGATASLNSCQLAEVRAQDRLRTAPDQKEKGLAAPAAGRMTDDVASAFGGGRAPIAWPAAPGCWRACAIPRSNKPPAPSAERQQVVGQRVGLAAQFGSRSGEIGSLSATRDSRKLIAAVDRPTARVEVCRPPVPAPLPAGITFSSGPANRQSCGTRTPDRRTSPVELADRPTSRGGWRSADAGQAGVDGHQNLPPVGQGGAEHDHVGGHGAGDPGAIAVEDKAGIGLAGSEHRRGQVPAAGGEVRNADRGKGGAIGQRRQPTGLNRAGCRW